MSNRCKKFKRSRRRNMGIMGIILLFLSEMYMLKGDYKVTLCLSGLTTLIVIIMAILPEDFNYSIRGLDSRIIFEMSKYDHRPLNYNFCIQEKNWYCMILDDGFSKIKIAYDKDVLKFLDEIQN